MNSINRKTCFNAPNYCKVIKTSSSSISISCTIESVFNVPFSIGMQMIAKRCRILEKAKSLLIVIQHAATLFVILSYGQPHKTKSHLVYLRVLKAVLNHNYSRK